MSYRLGKNILATITYYDVLEMPLTSFEIWKHLITQNFEQVVCDRPCTLGDIVKFLAEGQLDKKIEEKNGFYFLSGREHLVTKRIQAEKISVLKLKRMTARTSFGVSSLFTDARGYWQLGDEEWYTRE